MTIYYTDTISGKCVEILNVEEIICYSRFFRYRKKGSKRFFFIYRDSNLVKVFDK